MKQIALVFVLPLALAAQAQEEEFPPKAYPLERYAVMMQRSPFVLPTFSQDVSVQVNWAADFSIVSVLKTGEETVLLAKKISTGERVPVRSTDNRLGIRLVKMNLSSDPREVSAVVELGGEEGTIRYDDAILSQLPKSVVPNNPAVIPE
jgi:hypothetical protein